jgi:hypothetical protein
MKKEYWFVSVSILAVFPGRSEPGPDKALPDLLPWSGHGRKSQTAIQLVPAADVKTAIEKKEKRIIRVRDPGNFPPVISWAMNISRGILNERLQQDSDQNAKIYVSYCKTARSAPSTKTLNDLGYKNAV